MAGALRQLYEEGGKGNENVDNVELYPGVFAERSGRHGIKFGNVLSLGLLEVSSSSFSLTSFLCDRTYTREPHTCSTRFVLSTRRLQMKTSQCSGLMHPYDPRRASVPGRCLCSTSAMVLEQAKMPTRWTCWTGARCLGLERAIERFSLRIMPLCFLTSGILIRT